MTKGKQLSARLLMVSCSFVIYQCYIRTGHPHLPAHDCTGFAYISLRGAVRLAKDHLMTKAGVYMRDTRYAEIFDNFIQTGIIGRNNSPAVMAYRQAQELARRQAEPDMRDELTIKIEQEFLRKLEEHDVCVDEKGHYLFNVNKVRCGTTAICMVDQLLMQFTNIHSIGTGCIHCGAKLGERQPRKKHKRQGEQGFAVCEFCSKDNKKIKKW